MGQNIRHRKSKSEKELQTRGVRDTDRSDRRGIDVIMDDVEPTPNGPFPAEAASAAHGLSTSKAADERRPVEMEPADGPRVRRDQKAGT